MSRYVLILLLLTLGLAVALRVPHLSERPMHNDEAVNGIKFGSLWEKGTYRYDPNEHHGPTLYYATLALGRMTGAPDIDHYSEGRLRWVTILFGLGLLLLLPLVRDGLGGGTAWAGLFTAISPALVFYSQYYIHEMLLVFSGFLALASGWRYWRDRKIGWALLAGVGIGLMHATKETFALSVVAAGLALGLNQIWNRYLDASGRPERAPRLNFAHVAAGLGAWLGVFAILFTSFFTNWAGIADSVKTYLPWLSRAGGESPHIHPWSFYLQHLLWFHPARGPAWTEIVIFLLAMVAGAAGFIRKRLAKANASFIRFLTLYAFILLGFYSFIAYKTPWCLLNFWHPMVLLAGVGAAVLVRTAGSAMRRVGVATAILLVSAHLAWEAWELGGSCSADRRNPYVYAQTSPDILNLVAQVQALAEVSPEAYQTLIKIVSPDSDYWPLPWYLRRFKQTGWYDQLPPDPYAPLMIVSARLQAGLDRNKTHLMVRYFELRPRVFLELYVELELWKKYLSAHPPRSGDDR
jgi:uncharacterized protein (TIGR03663 family)